MTIIEFTVIMLLNIIILTLALKTKIYYKILVIIKRMMPKIIFFVVLIWPLCLFVLLLTILNAICSLPNETIVSETINSNYLGGLKEFGLNCILYSPKIFLAMSFLLQGLFYMKSEENEIPKTKNTRNDILRMKISIYSGNITIFLGLAFIFLSKNINAKIFDMKFIHFIQGYQFSEIIMFSEYSILMLLVIVLCFFCYMSIFWISDTCLVFLSIHDKTIIGESNKAWKYRLLVYIIVFNIYFIYLMNKQIDYKSRKNST